MNELDDREMMDIEPSNPLGSFPVTFSVPIPSIEQVAGEIASQVLQSQGYPDRQSLEIRTSDAIDKIISNELSERAGEVISEALGQPLQPTDGFGHPIGDKTTLHQIFVRRIEDWCSDTVDHEGRPKRYDGYGNK